MGGDGLWEAIDLCTLSWMSELRKFAVGLVQMVCAADPEENLRRGLVRVEQAARGGAQVICLPELFRSQYFCQREDPACFDLAEPIPGPTTEAVAEAARKAGVVVVAPVFERRAAGLYHNSAAVIDADGRIAGVYRKMHIPDDPAYYEKFYFTPGDLGFQSFPTRAGRIATLICWDQWYPEGARLTALQGAAILFYPTAIGWHPSEKPAALASGFRSPVVPARRDQTPDPIPPRRDEGAGGAAELDAWRTVQRGHAIANGVYVAAVNRVGHEVPPGGGPGIEFWGNSFICDPQGVVVAQASADGEEILLAEVDLARLEDVRRNWPFLRDRRIDAYAGIDRRYLAEASWEKKE